MLQVCDAQIQQQLQQLASRQTSGAVRFLDQMNQCWQDYCSQMLTIRSIFLYLDRTYVISDSSVRSIFDMGLRLFRTHLATHPEVRTLVLGTHYIVNAKCKLTHELQTLQPANLSVLTCETH